MAKAHPPAKFCHVRYFLAAVGHGSFRKSWAYPYELSAGGRARASACSPARYCRWSLLCAQEIDLLSQRAFGAHRRSSNAKRLETAAEKQAEITGKVKVACWRSSTPMRSRRRAQSSAMSPTRAYDRRPDRRADQAQAISGNDRHPKGETRRGSGRNRMLAGRA